MRIDRVWEKGPSRESGNVETLPVRIHLSKSNHTSLVSLNFRNFRLLYKFEIQKSPLRNKADTRATRKKKKKQGFPKEPWFLAPKIIKSSRNLFKSDFYKVNDRDH